MPFTELRAICACGKTIPLPPSAFTTGAHCGSCGEDVSPAELASIRPRGVSRSVYLQSLIILALLSLGQAFLLARPYLTGSYVGLVRQWADFGRSLPTLTVVAMRLRAVWTCPLALAAAVLVTLAWGLRARGRAGYYSLWPSVVMFGWLAVAWLSTAIFALALQLPMVELIESLN